MQISVKREEILDGVSFTEIIDKKFKTNVVKVMFVTKLSEKEAPLNTFASMLLSSTNSRIKTNFEMSDVLNALYDSTLRSGIVTYGDSQIVEFTIGCIDNRFALDNDDILGQLLAILEDCLFSPNVSDGKFDEDEFRLRKKELIDIINSEMNNKRYYAFNQACKSIFVGEPSAFSHYGDIETAENIKSEEVYEAYKKLIKTSHVEIYYVSPTGEFPVKERFKKAFSQVEREPVEGIMRTPSPIKPEVLYKEESCEMLQAQVVMAYKTHHENVDACGLFSRILGGTAFSKLFVNVREKQSLCYYCSSSYIQSKGTIYIVSGVENDNCEKLVKAVDEQIEAIRKGEFTDEEFYNTKLFIVNNMRSRSDFPGSLASWYFSGYCSGEIISLEEGMEKIMNVTREQIIEVANTLVLDTVYTLKADRTNMEGGQEDGE